MSEFNIEELNLESGEGVLHQTYDIWNFDGEDEHNFDYLYLTNKNIIRVTEKSKMFSKAETIVQKIPLSAITKAAYVNDEEYGNGLRVYYKDGKSDLYELCDVPKKDYPKWTNAINSAIINLTGKEDADKNVVPSPVIKSTVEERSISESIASATTVDTNDEDTKNDKFIAGATAFMSSGKSVVDVAKQTFSETYTKPIAEHVFCTNCGTKNNVEAKFCQGCGAQLGVKPKNVQQVESAYVTTSKATTEAETHYKESVDESVHNKIVETVVKEQITKRNTVYEGNVHKCPHCHETLNSFTGVCPSCGSEIRDSKTSNAVREFSLKLEAIESSRPVQNMSFKKVLANQHQISETDQHKINLIRSFAIPNNKEDILEFLVLASSNINERRDSIWEPLNESEKAVSDAWKAKFEQAYEKAKLLFGSSREFQNIEHFYKNKNKQIKDKKFKSVFSYIAFFVGIFVAIFIMFGIMKWIIN